MMYYTDSSRMNPFCQRSPCDCLSEPLSEYYSVKPYTDEHNVSHGWESGWDSDLIHWTRIGMYDSSAVYESKG